MLFRCLVPALALMQGVALAQSAPPFTCDTTTGVPALARVEGQTEIVTDVVLVCTGGTPTPSGSNVPQTTFSVFLNVSETSRLLIPPWSEALALIDDPGSAAHPLIPQLVCGAPSAPDGPPGVCTYIGTGTGVVYDGSVAHPNVFQGQAGLSNVLTWTLPIDPPGPGTRTIRFTNIRAAATLLAPIKSPLTGEIKVDVAAAGPLSITINNPVQIVAFTEPSLKITSPGNPVLKACVPQNVGLLPAAVPGTGTPQFHIHAEELFAPAWKARSTAPYGGPNVSPVPAPFVVPGAVPQDSETNFYNPAYPLIAGRGNLGESGLADEGTRIGLIFTGIPAGVELFTSQVVNLVFSGTTTPSGGVLRLVTPGTPLGSGPFVPAPGFSNIGAVTKLGLGIAVAYFEVLTADPFAIEAGDLPIYVAYTSASPTISLVDGTYAPISLTNTASATEPIPRFAPTVDLQSAFRIEACH